MGRVLRFGAADDTNHGFRTTKLVWKWNGDRPALTELGIKYKKKTGRASSSAGDCAEKSVNIPTLTDTSYIFEGIEPATGGLLQNTKYEFHIYAEATVRRRILRLGPGRSAF